MADLHALKLQAGELAELAIDLRARLRMDEREERLAGVVTRSEDPNLWGDPDLAQQVMTEMARRKAELLPWRRLASMAEDTLVLAELSLEADDESGVSEMEANLRELRTLLAKLETEALFADRYDTANAIIEVNAGAGGTEACDWASMLGRMYLRWAELHNFTAEIIDELPGDQAGVKSLTIEISGANAYGYLKSERGPHRLIRFSPFNAKGTRETSFASVDVIPDMEDDAGIEIRDDDLRVDTYRSSGAGGQHVNKTESAIRITHIPSGIVVSCQNERSQIKNRASAMRVLKARLLERQRIEQEATMAKIRGVKTDIAFGNQIRTYFLQPYTLVKDHRTDHETPNALGVLDGDLDGFMVAYLQMLTQQRVEAEG